MKRHSEPRVERTHERPARAETSEKAPPPPSELAPEQRRFGAHMSTAGGLCTAFDRAVDTGCDVMQVFVKNQRQWRARPLDDEAIAAWDAARDRTGIRMIVAHDAYLINLAAPQDAVWKASIDAFLDELTRCRQTGIRWLVTHPGSHNGTGEDAGITRVAQAMDIIYDRVGDCGVTTLLETTAGQGTNLGYRFEHLRDIIAATRGKLSLAVCLDTCHLFAAGYDLTTDAGYGRMTDALAGAIGTQAVRCIHMNDSKKPLGSRVDRHEHIGKGEIGRTAFGRLINDRRFLGVPMILETPKEKDARGREMDQVNLAILRKLISAGKAGR